jgi:addiction module RelE/StbE family toxin
VRRPAAFTLVWTETFARTAKKFLRGHPELQKTLRDVLRLLETKPSTPSLRLHALSGRHKGKHAVRLTYAYRVVLVMRITEKEIVLLDIGSHDDVY